VTLAPYARRLALVRQPARVARGVRRRVFLARRPVRLGATRAAQLEVVLDGLRDFQRLMCASAPKARLIELEGVVASVMPATPERALMNEVVYERPVVLANALDALAAIYAEAGVEAWGVFAPAVDGQAKRLLKRAGLVRTDSPTSLARRLRHAERPSQSLLEDWTAEGEPAELAAICDRAFSFGTAFARVFSTLRWPTARVYVARVAGKPASCVLTSYHDGNCAIDLTATVPEAQGRGLAGALLAHALADAEAARCRTTTVVAGRLGERVYGRLGYRVVCPIQQWVRVSTTSPARRTHSMSTESREEYTP
jgi:GNAT superfamily N-acetyltransferase